MVVRKAEKREKKNPYLPIIGLMIAVALGVIAFFSAPLILDLLAKNVDSIALKVQDKTTDYERNMRLIIAFILWLTSLSVMVMIVASMDSTNIVQEEYKNLVPRTNNPKDVAKFEKQAAKNREAQIKAVKKLAKKQEQEKKRRG